MTYRQKSNHKILTLQQMKKIVKKHPLATRWFHWINFPVLAIMTWSGLLIYWANDVYRLGWDNTPCLNFSPIHLIKLWIFHSTWQRA
jgi:hypothetical protein